MRAISVQVQPSRVTEGDPEDLVASLKGTADDVVLSYVGEDRGDDDGGYINVGFAAADHIAAWSRLQGVYDGSALGRQMAKSTIATCEGENGWDDYLLLHHFDPDEKTDSLDC